MPKQASVALPCHKQPARSVFKLLNLVINVFLAGYVWKIVHCVQESGAKETPMERLKRLRAAQLNKTFQKDVLTNAQRKANEERDRAARLQIERVAYADQRGSPSPPPRLSNSSPLSTYCRSHSVPYSPRQADQHTGLLAPIPSKYNATSDCSTCSLSTNTWLRPLCG